MHRSVALLLAYVAGGGLYGFAVSAIPAPTGTEVFWIANLCAPWLVLSFLAGWPQRSWALAATAGVLAAAACVTGFYLKLLTLDPVRLGLSESTPFLTVAMTATRTWLTPIVQWFLAALLAGSLYGALGRWWGRSRSIIAGAAVGLPFLAEPWLWRLADGSYKGPLGIWIAEALVGIGVLAWVVIAWRSRANDRLKFRVSGTSGREHGSHRPDQLGHPGGIPPRQLHRTGADAQSRDGEPAQHRGHRRARGDHHLLQ